MKKRIVSTLLLCLILLFSTACESTSPPRPTIPSETTQNTPQTTFTPSPAPEIIPSDESTEAPGEYSTVEVHFLDIGQGDAVLIKGETQALLIDGGTTYFQCKQHFRGHN